MSDLSAKGKTALAGCPGAEVKEDKVLLEVQPSKFCIGTSTDSGCAGGGHGCADNFR